MLLYVVACESTISQCPSLPKSFLSGTPISSFTPIRHLNSIHMLHQGGKPTFSRNISVYRLPTAQPDPRDFPLTRIGFLRVHNAHPHADAFQFRTIRHFRRCWTALWLRLSSASEDLVVRRELTGSVGKGAS